MIAKFNENSSSCKCQLDSMIQGASRGVEKRERETNRGRGSWRVGGRKNIEQKKDKRSRQISGAIEEVYSRTWLMGEERGFRKCKIVGKQVWRRIKGGSKKTRKNRYTRGKRIQKGNITEEVYGKVAIWMGWWEVRGRIPEEVRKELAKVEVSFSGGETLKKR